tara:strand:+ start:14252 stop:15454 length:1203 start_codon:yes stop_codon:yes gene_type:complete
MISPKIPDNERLRQRSVEQYKLLDTLEEEDYDSITFIASYITQTPISLITLLDRDRNFLKAHLGIEMSESPRRLSFCGHAINAEEEIMIVEDARLDPRFHDNPLVVNLQAIFYAGVPLVNPEGFKLGTLCVYDNQPRTLTKEQIQTLIKLSKQVVNLLEQRKLNIELLAVKKQLEKRNENLKNFAGIISHDLKSPLANIFSLTELLQNESDNILTPDSIEYLKYLKSSSHSIGKYIDGMLKFYKSDELLSHEVEGFELKNFIGEVESIAVGDKVQPIIHLDNEGSLITNKHALFQIFVNLINNAIKYNDKKIVKINIGFQELENHYQFYIKDNGVGIEESQLDSVFDLFKTTGQLDRDGQNGTGIGLATVQKTVHNLGGEITVQSKVDLGSIFTFTIEKP